MGNPNLNFFHTWRALLMIILASAVRPAKAIITWLSRTQIFCTVLSSCSLAWNLNKKYRHIIKSIRKMPLFDKKKWSKFLPQPFFRHQEQQRLCLGHQLLWIPFWRLLEHIQPRKNTYNQFICFITWKSYKRKSLGILNRPSA